MSRLFIAAAHKSSGKTTLALGLAAALRETGGSVQPFKKGPDYIDPLWLTRAAGRACINLDFNTMSHDEITAAFTARAGDLSLIEGNKGLYDGVDPAGSDSNAALARLLRAPVILVIDTTGMTRGIAPLLCGYVAFDPGVAIAGVILNRVGGARHEGKLRAAIEHYTDLPVLGALGRDKELAIEERHLGLTPPREISGADAHIARIAGQVRAGVNLDDIVAVAARSGKPERAPPARNPTPAADIRIAYAADAAFGFYYPDDLEAMRRAGAELIAFDATRDPRLPDADGLFVGGGFPEARMEALEANRALRDAIRTALANGMPAYAECGGLMYLARSLQWRGERREMVGVVPGDVVMHDRPQGRGHVVLEETAHAPWPGGAQRPRIRAHEFHYASLEGLPRNTVYAYTVRRGHGLDGRNDGIVMGNLLAGFSHLRHTAANPWADRFIAHVRARRR